MSTTLYISNEAADVSPVYSDGWEYTDDCLGRYKLKTSAQGVTTIDLSAIVEDRSNSIHEALAIQLVSEQLEAQTILGTGVTQSLCFRGIEDSGASATLAWVVKVVSGDGGTVRAEYGPYADGTEFDTGSLESRYGSTYTAEISVQSGDRLVIEVGIRFSNTKGTEVYSTLDIRSGATNDLDGTDTDTDDDNAWIYLADTLSFQTGSTYEEEVDLDASATQGHATVLAAVGAFAASAVATVALVGSLLISSSLGLAATAADDHAGDVVSGGETYNEEITLSASADIDEEGLVDFVESIDLDSDADITEGAGSSTYNPSIDLDADADSAWVGAFEAYEEEIDLDASASSIWQCDVDGEIEEFVTLSASASDDEEEKLLFVGVEIQSGSSYVSTGDEVTLTFDQTATAGNILIALVSLQSGRSATTPSGWTKMFTSGLTQWEIFYKISDGTETGVTIELDDSSFNFIASYTELLGPWESSPIDVTSIGPFVSANTHYTGETGNTSQAKTVSVVLSSMFPCNPDYITNNNGHDLFYIYRFGGFSNIIGNKRLSAIGTTYDTIITNPFSGFGQAAVITLKQRVFEEELDLDASADIAQIDEVEGGQTYEESVDLDSDADIAQTESVDIYESVDLDSSADITEAYQYEVNTDITLSADADMTKQSDIFDSLALTASADDNYVGESTGNWEDSLTLASIASTILAPNMDIEESIDLDANAENVEVGTIDTDDDLTFNTDANIVEAYEGDYVGSIDLDASAASDYIGGIVIDESIDLDSIASISESEDVSLDESIDLDSSADYAVDKNILRTGEIDLDSTTSITESSEHEIDESISLSSSADFDEVGESTGDYDESIDLDASATITELSEHIIEELINLSSSASESEDGDTEVEDTLAISAIASIAQEGETTVKEESLTLSANANIEWYDGYGWIEIWPAPLTLGGFSNTIANNTYNGRIIISPTIEGSKIRASYKGSSAVASPIHGSAIAVRDGETDDYAASATRITFNSGNNTVTIPAGETVVSDEIDFAINAGVDYLLHIFVDGYGAMCYHGWSGEDPYYVMGYGSDLTLVQIVSMTTISTVRDLVKLEVYGRITLEESLGLEASASDNVDSQHEKGMAIDLAADASDEEIVGTTHPTQNIPLSADAEIVTYEGNIDWEMEMDFDSVTSYSPVSDEHVHNETLDLQVSADIKPGGAELGVELTLASEASHEVSPQHGFWYEAWPKEYYVSDGDYTNPIDEIEPIEIEHLQFRTPFDTTYPGIKVRVTVRGHSTNAGKVFGMVVGKRDGQSEDWEATPIPITFNDGELTVDIPAGTDVVSDEIDIAINPMSNRGYMVASYRKSTYPYVNRVEVEEDVWESYTEWFWDDDSDYSEWLYYLDVDFWDTVYDQIYKVEYFALYAYEESIEFDLSAGMTQVSALPIKHKPISYEAETDIEILGRIEGEPITFEESIDLTAEAIHQADNFRDFDESITLATVTNQFDHWDSFYNTVNGWYDGWHCQEVNPAGGYFCQLEAAPYYYPNKRMYIANVYFGSLPEAEQFRLRVILYNHCGFQQRLRASFARASNGVGDMASPITQLTVDGDPDITIGAGERLETDSFLVSYDPTVYDMYCHVWTWYNQYTSGWTVGGMYTNTFDMTTSADLSMTGNITADNVTPSLFYVDEVQVWDGQRYEWVTLGVAPSLAAAVIGLDASLDLNAVADASFDLRGYSRQITLDLTRNTDTIKLNPTGEIVILNKKLITMED